MFSIEVSLHPPVCALVHRADAVESRRIDGYRIGGDMVAGGFLPNRIHILPHLRDELRTQPLGRRQLPGIVTRRLRHAVAVQPIPTHLLRPARHGFPRCQRPHHLPIRIVNRERHSPIARDFHGKGNVGVSRRGDRENRCRGGEAEFFGVHHTPGISAAVAERNNKPAPSIQGASRTNRTSTSRSTYFHSSDARSRASSLSNSAVSVLANSNHVRKSNGSASPKSRQ